MTNRIQQLTDESTENLADDHPDVEFDTDFGGVYQDGRYVGDNIGPLQPSDRFSPILRQTFGDIYRVAGFSGETSLWHEDFRSEAEAMAYLKGRTVRAEPDLLIQVKQGTRLVAMWRKGRRVA